MTEQLATTIRQDWFVISQTLNNPHEMMALFKLAPHELDTVLKDLRNAVIEGIFEYKRTSVTSILRPLQSLYHDSRAIEQLPSVIETSRTLLAVTLLQRLFCLGKLKPSEKKSNNDKLSGDSGVENNSFSPVTIREILEYIQKEIHVDPERMKNTEIKKILMYSKMYKNEINKMKDLAVNIPPEKKQLLMENFNKSLHEITAKLNTAYNVLREGESTPPPAAASAHHLSRFDYSPLAPLLKSQAQFFSEILSSLTFAKREKFRTRELLTGLADRQETFMQHIDKEQKAYEEIDPFDKKGLKAGREFATEIIKYLRKEREWLKLHPW